jgi:hypothetical protein
MQLNSVPSIKRRGTSEKATRNFTEEGVSKFAMQVFKELIQSL